MMIEPFYRYFLGFRPDESLRHVLMAAAVRAGQQDRHELFHLTLCVIAEVEKRDRFLRARVGAALEGHALSSMPIRLGRIQGGPLGAMIRTIGKQSDIQGFYQMLLRLLEPRGIAPLHRKSGLRPHVTLGYVACRFDPFDIAAEWFPGELLLIESKVGRGTHHVIGRWPLLPPPQGELAFDMPPLRLAC